MTTACGERCVRVAGVVGVAAAVLSGCKTKEMEGGLAGAGVGPLIGQPSGEESAHTLSGRGLGGGVGYIIGDELDRADVENRDEPMPAELIPLIGTDWELVSVEPAPPKSIRSMVVRFKPGGRVATKRTFEDGKSVSAEESYRVVGYTLIVNRPGYIVNAKIRIEGGRLYLETAERRAVFRSL